MSFLFKKPKKNIQRRVFGSQEDDENIMDYDETNDKKSQDNRKDRKEKNKPKQTLLSFDVDDSEENEVFQVKKSSHSKKIMRMLDKERKKKNKEIMPDKLDENEESNKKKNSKEIITDDLVVIVKSPPKKDIILNGRDALVAGRDDLSSEEEEISSKSFVTKHKFSQPENLKIIVGNGIIPDAAMIHAARKRRQRARELGGDFIPIESEEKKDKGRLIREDNDGDDSDDERVDMQVSTHTLDLERRREQFSAAQNISDNEHESDQETEEWENQQIRKGVTGAQLNSAQNYYQNYFGSDVLAKEDVSVNKLSAEMLKSELNENKGPKTPENILNNLRDRVMSLQNIRNKNMKKLAELDSDLELVNNELEELNKKAPECANRFKFYQELRGYVADLVECFDEKISIISNLEQKWLDLMSKKANILAERRRQDVRDQAEEVTLQAKTGQQLNRVRNNSKSKEEENRIRRTAEREGRRTRRRRTREQAMLISQVNNINKHLEGMSSDDEIPDQDYLILKQQKDQILQSTNQIFEDVVEEYSECQKILERFQAWRNIDLDSYKEAYAYLVLPKIISPIVRLEMLTWDPLQMYDTGGKCYVELEEYTWMKFVMLYGINDSQTIETMRSDPDINLLPAVVDKIILPKLNQYVEKIWDPMSSSQSLKLVTLVNRLIKKYPTLGPGSQTLNALFLTILDKLQQAVEHDVFIPIFPKQILDTKASFFQRQFNSAVKLMGNITCWQGTLADHVLKNIVINSLLNRYLLSGLRVCKMADAISKAQLIINSLPRVWIQSSDAKTELRLFISCLDQLSSQIDIENQSQLEHFDVLNKIRSQLRL